MAAMLKVKNKNISIPWKLHVNSFKYFLLYWQQLRPCQGRGGGCHVTHLNFKTSHVGVYKCFMLLSEIEQKFFVFVGIVEKGDSDAL